MKRIVIGFVLAVVAIVPNARLRAQGSLDMQSFFVGATNMWPRTGSHQMNQVLVNNTLYWMKMGDSTSFELFYGDASGNIRFWEDHSVNATPYIFSETLWLNRYMSVGDQIDHPTNTITYGDANCQVTSTGSFPYRTKLEAYWPSYNTGSDLGTRDVILVQYFPNPAIDYFERYYYVAGAGWAAWEQWQNGTMQNQTIFATFGGSDVQPSVSPCRGTPPSS